MDQIGNVCKNMRSSGRITAFTWPKYPLHIDFNSNSILSTCTIAGIILWYFNFPSQSSQLFLGACFTYCLMFCSVFCFGWFIMNRNICWCIWIFIVSNSSIIGLDSLSNFVQIALFKGWFSPAQFWRLYSSCNSVVPYRVFCEAFCFLWSKAKMAAIH